VIYEWDDLKRQANIAKHGVDFSLAEDFDWKTAHIEQDLRSEYGEARFVAFGWIDNRLYVLVFTRRGHVLRIIGLRKANQREVERYEKTKA